MSRRSIARSKLYPYKSKLEVKVQELVPNAPYEQDKLTYTKVHTYNPDWTLAPGVFLEAKGRWDSADRAKHLEIIKQHPDVKVYFVFERPENTLNKRSKTTYAAFCDKHGIEWTTVEKGIPAHWLKGKKKSGN